MEDYDIYLIIINIFGLVFGGIFSLQRNIKIKRFMYIFLVVISLFGGSLGILLSFLLLDRKIRKENAMLKIFVLCLLVVQIIIYLVFCKNVISNFSFSFYDFCIKNKFFLFYIIFINIY